MSTYNKDNIIHVWDQLRKKEPNALSYLFRLTSDRLFRYGTKICPDEELVKDCIQELFVKLYETSRELPHTTNPLFYLFKALKNILYNAIRSNEKYLLYSQEDMLFQVDFYYEAEDEKDSISEEMHEKLETLFQSLSTRQKEAVYLKYKMDMSYEEISQLLGINYQSTRNLVHRAIEKIRAENEKTK